jgi:uncharacterized membrane protein YcaP (DUF421 family)
MDAWKMPDWGSILVPDLSLAESFARGSVVYLALIVLFRVVMKRQTGSLGLPDLMLVVLVSECVSTALSNEAKSVVNGLVAVGALLFWSFALDRIGHKWPWFQRLLEPQPVVLVEDGKPNRENLNREGITDEELEAQLREHGIEELNLVKKAILEAEGTVSVVPQPAAVVALPGLPPAPKRDLEGSVKRFLSVADELRAAVEWHERRAADHRAAAKMTRSILARHGLGKSKPRNGGKK